MPRREYYRWAILWPQRDREGGATRGYLKGRLDTRMTALYLTREEARKDEDMLKYNEMLKRRKDLRGPPFNWRAKRPVKVKVTVETV